MAVRALGWRAHAALVASGGRVDVIASLSDSCYATAAGELVWLGPRESTLHGRSVLVDDVSAARGQVHVHGVSPWRPRLPHARLGRGASADLLRDVLAHLGPPLGLGRLLGPSETDDDVLRRARPVARALGAICARGDLKFLADAARPLLGLGEGLTPSGDDFVGGVLFAQRLLASGDAVGHEGAVALDAAVTRIVNDAATLTHPISARLLADLAAGEGWAPLHELAAALAAQEPAAVTTAARAVVALGHSSGWSLQVGLMTGFGVPPKP